MKQHQKFRGPNAADTFTNTAAVIRQQAAALATVPATVEHVAAMCGSPQDCETVRGSLFLMQTLAVPMREFLDVADPLIAVMRQALRESQFATEADKA